MATHTPKPIVYIFNEINIGKYTETKHYKISKPYQCDRTITELLNISKNRFYAKANPVYWVKTKKDNKWQTPCLTGLFKTKQCNTLIGDISINNIKTHTLLFVFSNNAKTLTAYLFKNYYTRNVADLKHFTTL